MIWISQNLKKNIYKTNTNQKQVAKISIFYLLLSNKNDKIYQYSENEDLNLPQISYWLMWTKN